MVRSHVKHNEQRVEPCIPIHGHIHRSLEFAFDPGDFVCDPSKVIPYVFDRGVIRMGRWAEEAESDYR